MRMRIRTIAVVGLAGAVLLCSTGCLFNLFQTARTVGAGNIGLAFGSGIYALTIDSDTSYFLTPQARLAIGIAQGVDLGFQTGLMISLEGGDPGWLGAIGDVKFALLDQPGAAAIAVGLGGGYSLEAIGWEVFGELFFESNFRYLPVFLTYQPALCLTSGAMAHHLTGGLKLAISPQARVLIQVDWQPVLGVLFGGVSYGIAFEILL
ncbi:MAG: hypothetical protein PHX77_01285 [Candidatus Bipolaricaulis sp.]|nr:hypothetical protein [Candidatus Bipolaricaulis sp.]